MMLNQLRSGIASRSSWTMIGRYSDSTAFGTTIVQASRNADLSYVEFEVRGVGGGERRCD